MVRVGFIDRDEIYSLEELSHLPFFYEYDNASLPFLNHWSDKNPTIEVQTSGSTGAPKKILLTKESMRASAQLTLDYFNLKEGGIILQCLPSSFIAGKMIWVRAVVGRLNVIVAKPTSNPIKELNSKVNFAAMTPHQVATVLDEAPDKMNFIETLIIGGAPVSGELLERLQSLKTKCFATYGMTETVTHVAVKQLNHDKKTDFYQALPSISFSVGKEDNLKIMAPHISEDWLITEDVVELKKDNQFKWLGRKDFVINSGGVKLFPEVIEQKITHLIPVRFFIGKQEDETYGEVPVLILEGLKKFDLMGLNAVLSKIEMPKSAISVSKFKETGSGKIDRIATLQ